MGCAVPSDFFSKWSNPLDEATATAVVVETVAGNAGFAGFGGAAEAFPKALSRKAVRSFMDGRGVGVEFEAEA